MKNPIVGQNNMIEDKDLKKLFGNRVLAHRTVRRRLGVTDRQACGILRSALARGIIYRASGMDVGYNGTRKHFYGLTRE